MKRTRTIKDITTSQNPICFYTGLVCNRETNSPLMASLEHIIPFTALECDKEFQENEVVAAYFINNLLDTVPIKVKFEIKQKLSNIIVPGFLSEERMLYKDLLSHKF